MLPRDASSADAFRLTIAALLQSIAAQQPQVCGRDPAGVHQMRIALRRTRAALSVFSDLVDGREAQRFNRELKSIAGRLAPSRDLHLLELKFSSADVGGTSPAFLKRLTADRARAFDKAKTTVEQPRFRALLRDLGQWIEHDKWAATAPAADPRQPAKAFAKQVLTRRADKLLKKLDHLERLDDEQRHRVRIAAKKLNYAIGFFESLFEGHRGGRRLERFRKHLKKLLDALGALNDMAVQRELANKLGSRPRAKLDPVAIGHLSKADEAAFRKQMKAAVKAAAKLADDPLFGD